MPAATRGKKRPAAATAAEDDDVADGQKKQAPATKKSKKKVKSEEPTIKDEEAVPEVSADPQSAQVAKSASLVVPVDDYCPYTNYTVFIDSDGIIYDAALNQTNAGNNNNKFYKIQILTDGKGDFKTWTRWGRVGEMGQNAVLGSGSYEDAFSNFNKKFKDKSGLAWLDRGNSPKPKKYVFVERTYEDDSDAEAGAEDGSNGVKKEEDAEEVPPPECTLAPSVQSLMHLIFNQDYLRNTMADLNYDVKKMPLGKLSKNTITRGYEALKKISDILVDPPNFAQHVEPGERFSEAMERLSNLYYSYIPHAFGRNRPPIIDDNASLKKEVELLDSLTDMKVADNLEKERKSKAQADMHVMDAQFKGLGLSEMEPLDVNTDEFTNISNYLKESRGATHGHKYQVLDIFRIEREGESDRFKTVKKNMSDRRLLWHGSRSTNFGGILSQGLRIAPPEAPVNGYMFGKGVYLADMSSKSANYCCSRSSGGHALLLLCEAELGKPMHELTNASYTAGEDAIAKGSLSTWGQGTTGPSKWKDAKVIHKSLAGVRLPDTSTLPGNTNVANAFLQYNEYIVYDISQVRLRYLLRVKM